MKSVIPLKKKVNESLSALQELVDKNKLSLGCKLNGTLRGRVLNMYENGSRYISSIICGYICEMNCLLATFENYSRSSQNLIFVLF